jgi:cardiolipin hydrolase
MTASQLDELLQKTWADRRLQTAERKVLSDWVGLNIDSDEDRALARSRAFALAHAEMASDPDGILDWLEEVVKVLSRPVERVAPTTQAKAFFSPGTMCVQEILRQINQVRSHCDICVFTITDDRITDALTRAHIRGVALRIITDDNKAHDLGSDIDKLVAVGIPCKIDRGVEAHMHHKFALFEGSLLLTGSFNWTRSASEFNEENLIVTPDPDLVTPFVKRFDYLWQKLPNYLASDR